MKLYYYPRSTFSQKVLIALYEKRVAFTPVILDLADPDDRAELGRLTPLGKVPVLVLDDGWKVPESSIVIEYVDTHFSSGTRLIPADPDEARQTRFHDRLADLYVNEPAVTLFFDARKPEEQRSPEAAAAARRRLDTMYAGLDERLRERTWLMGDAFTMADCALIPPLALCRALHPFDRWKNLTAYASRAFERPSVARVLEEVDAFIAKRSAA